MRRVLQATVLLPAVFAGLAGCERIAGLFAPGVPPPRSFMQGGVWFPAVTGYWLHQYVVGDELAPLLSDMGFACTPGHGADVASAESMNCERSFRVPGGVMARTDTIELKFRRNGAVDRAIAGCQYTFFDSAELAGTCTPFAAPGAVYPTVNAFAQVVLAMLQPGDRHQVINVSQLPAGPPLSLPDASATVDRLARWRFDCQTPQQKHRASFRGNVGEAAMIRCEQMSLGLPARPPQRQQVIIHYDSLDLAVRGIDVVLDDAVAVLPLGLDARVANTTPAPGSATPVSPASALPTAVTLENRSGERFDVPLGAVGTGSRQATLDGFALLTPASQRDLLMAYLAKLELQWSRSPPDRLSYLNALALEWYGPEALPLLGALLSDDRPLVGVALLKHLCFVVPAKREPTLDYSVRSERLMSTMEACIERQRPAMPASIAMMDRLLAQDLRVLGTSDARALNAFGDFRRDVSYVVALGPDAAESRAALDATVAGKVGLAPGIQSLIDAALAPRATRAR